MIPAINGVLWNFPNYTAPISEDVVFVDIAGSAQSLAGGSVSFTHNLTTPLTNGYMLLAMRFSTSAASGDNLATFINGTGMTAIPVGGGMSGIAYNTNRSLYVRGIPLGNFGTGSYNISILGTGFGSVSCLAASTFYSNVNQTVPTGAIVTSGASLSTSRTAYPLSNVGDMAIGVFGQVNSTGVSGVFGPNQTLVFNSGSANILAVSTSPATSPDTFLHFRTTGNANGALLGFALKMA